MKALDSGHVITKMVLIARRDLASFPSGELPFSGTLDALY